MNIEWIKCSERNPEKPAWYLVDNTGWDDWHTAYWTGVKWCNTDLSPTHWAEVNRPPKPDPFELWWEGLKIGVPGYRIHEGHYLCEDAARIVWDAATKAGKEKHE